MSRFVTLYGFYQIKYIHTEYNMSGVIIQVHSNLYTEVGPKSHNIVFFIHKEQLVVQAYIRIGN